MTKNDRQNTWDTIIDYIWTGDVTCLFAFAKLYMELLVVLFC